MAEMLLKERQEKKKLKKERTVEIAQNEKTKKEGVDEKTRVEEDRKKLAQSGLGDHLRKLDEEIAFYKEKLREVTDEKKALMAASKWLGISSSYFLEKEQKQKKCVKTSNKKKDKCETETDSGPFKYATRLKRPSVAKERLGFTLPSWNERATNTRETLTAPPMAILDETSSDIETDKSTDLQLSPPPNEVSLAEVNAALCALELSLTENKAGAVDRYACEDSECDDSSFDYDWTAWDEEL
ncbi:hypothetical protein QR680_016117 [Steinernema hermaphroditum]|uniref:Uncharacterized protein n=1 Tax=Steinernema hermaphroditum TaxID=289476 RepID=A0AA39HA43_9BILA|nr:hypothetical protein QR680_016117 [Steinernema hermaphroditum]